MTLVEVTLEKVYYSKLNFTIVNGTVSVTGIFQFTIALFRLERATEVLELTYLGKYFACVNAN